MNGTDPFSIFVGFIVGCVIGALAIFIIVGLIPNDETFDEDEIAVMVDQMVDSLMSNPEYLAYLEDDEDLVNRMVESMIAHPTYQAYLETTPEEECAATILAAATVAGDYSVLPDADSVSAACEWYEEAVAQ